MLELTEYPSLSAILSSYVFAFEQYFYLALVGALTFALTSRSRTAMNCREQSPRPICGV